MKHIGGIIGKSQMGGVKNNVSVTFLIVNTLRQHWLNSSGRKGPLSFSCNFPTTLRLFQNEKAKNINCFHNLKKGTILKQILRRSHQNSFSYVDLNPRIKLQRETSA